ncbi:hypothetical protein LshimejAT787_1203830 [Lyophyllum shimeji]|uniref:Uncharacterized protein n=1 Tax=Lyophyllum shimeji TaxID=47721 RepID=A0A9P3PWM3_LYOSH|nr:hypothetical protein LshimejAT787_1203830 [Lyophyllum shimeji]
MNTHGLIRPKAVPELLDVASAVQSRYDAVYTAPSILGHQLIMGVVVVRKESFHMIHASGGTLGKSYAQP